jgi:hypothetical protein
MHDPILQDFTRRSHARFGTDNAALTQTGAVVALLERDVHINPDPESSRVALWVNLAPSEAVPIDLLESVAMDFTAERFLVSGVVMGVDRASRFVSLGRSFDAAVLNEDRVFELMDDLAREADGATRRIQAAFDATSFGREGETREGHPPQVQITSESSPPFVNFISRAARVLDLPEPHVSGDRYCFRVDERWVELIYRPQDDSVTLAAIAYLREPDQRIRADLVATFNAYHLFKSGLALVTSENALVYSCRSHRLSRLDPTQIPVLLERFASEAEWAGTWYMVECDQSEDAESGPKAASTTEALLRV